MFISRLNVISRNKMGILEYSIVVKNSSLGSEKIYMRL